MKYIKLYENIEGDRISEVTQTIKDILLEIEDDGLNCYLYKNNRYLLGPTAAGRMRFYSDYYKIAPLPVEFGGSGCAVYIRGEKYPGSMKSKLFNYSQIKPVVNRLKQYLMSEHIYKNIYIDRGDDQGWESIDEMNRMGVYLNPNAEILTNVIIYEL